MPDRSATGAGGHGVGDAGDDRTLMASVVRGDASAAEILVQRHGGRVWRYLGHVCGDRSWVDDLAQETLARAVQRAALYDPEYPLEVWLLRIARNLAIDLSRRERRHQRVEIRDEEAAKAAGPHAALEAREFRSAFDAAVRELPAGYREVFVLREFEGLDYASIGAVLDLSPKTVSSRLHRARLRLQGALGRFL